MGTQLQGSCGKNIAIEPLHGVVSKRLKDGNVCSYTRREELWLWCTVVVACDRELRWLLVMVAGHCEWRRRTVMVSGDGE